MRTSDTFINKINTGPIFLFLGQNFFQLNKEDYFLNKLSSKYHLERDDKYDIVFDESINNNPQFVDWANKILSNMPDPLWFDVINELPISSIYTSSLTPKLLKSFTNSFRTTTGVYSDRQVVVNPRNQQNLHINYLYGCFNQVELNYCVPKTLFDKTRRNTIASNMLQKIQDAITPFGILIIEGYDIEKDWLPIQHLYSLISNLSKKQVYIFSVNEKLKQDQFIEDLVKQEKLILIEESLGVYLENLKNSGVITANLFDYNDFYGHSVNIESKRLKIPNEIYNRISKSATVIESSIFQYPSQITDDIKITYYKDFLANSAMTPKWSGFPLGFAFKRDFYIELKNRILQNIKSNKLNVPTILNGQASSGKTIALGLLAYELYTELKIPILFVERKYTKLDEHDIDVFYNYVEQNGGDKIILIWDGMLEPSSYYGFLKRLEARGKNILLVGSSYRLNLTKDSANLLEANINLSKAEIKRFESYLSNFLPTVASLVQFFKEDNFLSMLYRYLDSSRIVIKQSLDKEISTASTKLSQELTRETKKQELDSNSLAFHLKNAGILLNEELLDFDREVLIAGDNITVSNKLLNMVMVPGQFGLPIPFDLIIRSIGISTFNQDLFKIFQKHDIIKWNDDALGNIYISPRTTFEASLIVKSLGGYQAQAEYIKDIIKSLRDSNIFDTYESNSDEIQFATELLSHISPNSNNVNFLPYLYEISSELSKLRESGLVINPRLMLQEASFLRELAKKNLLNQPISSEEMLEKAEEVLRSALVKVDNKKTLLHLNLQVELASILGTKMKHELNKGSVDKEKVADYFRSTYRQLLDSKLLGNNSYHAFDVLCWTSKAVIEERILNEQENLDLQIFILHLFDLYESEGIDEVHHDEFLGRKLELGEVLGKAELSDNALKELERKGSSTGYYLQARKKIGNISLNHVVNSEEDFNSINDAFSFLEMNLQRIENDAASFYLLFKLWWLTKTKHGFINDEKEVLPFNIHEWNKCIFFVERLKTFGDNYYTPTVQYIHGISLFHLERYPECINLFTELNDITDFSYVGKKRVIKSYIASDNNGNAKQYVGEVRYGASILNNQFKGEIFVPEIRINVPFTLRDFHYREVHTKQSISSFYIGFNFRGLIASPSN